ncbi:MAG: transcription termination factor Rho, partial [Paramuribaculum sp.]|nr:transcription termination factor Rho [Paramuribaculum sp.]
MYKYDELSSMNDSELKNIADSLGLKKIDSSDKEDVIYGILDQQAINASTSVAEKKAKQPKEPKQRKPRAKKTADQPVETSAEATAPTEAKPAAEAAEQKQPKKRGRKPKNTVADTPSADTPASVETPAQTAEPVAEPIATEQPAEGEAQAPKRRRGRRRKSEIEAEAAAQASAQKAPTPEQPQSEPETPAMPEQTVEPTVEVPQADQQDQQNQQHRNNQRDFRPGGGDSSFGSFFPRGEGRKFVPRSQREKEEAAAAAAVAPITLNEPWQNPRQQQNQNQKNRNKKNRNNNGNQQNQQQEQAYSFDNRLRATGVLEIVPEGHGFLRSSDYNYLASPDDVYLTQQQIRQNALKAGDVVEAIIRPPRENDKYYPLVEVLSVNGRSPQYIRDRIPFEHLTPLFPDEKFDLTSGRSANISTRVVDMFSPIGKGQRGLIVAPPKTGKTILLKDIANAIAANHPETYIMILLIDERPEEVTDMSR